MEVTTEMIHAAIKKAVELKIIPKLVDTTEYMRYWQGMKEILEAALDKEE